MSCSLGFCDTYLPTTSARRHPNGRVVFCSRVGAEATHAWLVGDLAHQSSEHGAGASRRRCHSFCEAVSEDCPVVLIRRVPHLPARAKEEILGCLIARIAHDAASVTHTVLNKPTRHKTVHATLKPLNPETRNPSTPQPLRPSIPQSLNPLNPETLKPGNPETL